LRKKVDAVAKDPLIHTIRSVGYTIRPTQESELATLAQ
jgi:DNA-binding response OmpR family regulator